MAQQQRNLPELISGSKISPFREMSRLQRSIDRLFDDMMAPFLGTSLMSPLITPMVLGAMHPSRALIEEQMAPQTFIPPMDVEETDNQYIVNVDLPGVTKNDITIETRDNQLIICGERKCEKVEEKGVHHAVERYHGCFQRSFMLPTTVNADQIQANFENGVLQIVIPKVESAHRKTIQIGERIGVPHVPTKTEKKEKAA